MSTPVPHPPRLLCDEPTANQNCESKWKLLETLQAEFNAFGLLGWASLEQTGFHGIPVSYILFFLQILQ